MAATKKMELITAAVDRNYYDSCFLSDDDDDQEHLQPSKMMDKYNSVFSMKKNSEYNVHVSVSLTGHSHIATADTERLTTPVY